ASRASTRCRARGGTARRLWGWSPASRPRRTRRRARRAARQCAACRNTRARCPRVACRRAASCRRSRSSSLFVGGDAFGERQDVAELVDAVRQTVLRERIDLERERTAVGQADALTREVDAQLGCRARVDQALDLRADRARQLDRQQAVLRRVLLEDV